MTEKLAALWRAFPDGRFTLAAMVAAGDRVTARSIFTGTQSGPFGPHPASGERRARQRERLGLVSPA